jgi:hypothetical protein
LPGDSSRPEDKREGQLDETQVKGLSGVSAQILK